MMAHQSLMRKPSGTSGERVLVLCSLGPMFDRVARERSYLLSPDGLNPAADDQLENVWAVVVRSGIAVDGEFLDRMPHLRLIIRAGSGVDNIDQAELALRSIRLRVRKHASARSVAELGMAGLISLARRMPEGTWSLIQRSWRKEQLIGESIATLRVVIWGAGPVGRACARLLAPAVRDVRFLKWPSVPKGFATTSLATALHSADVHFLCLPLRPSTARILDETVLDRVREARPYLVNLGRLELMDPAAVVSVLRQDGLRGVFVDALDSSDVSWVARVLNEQPINFLATPHLGAQRMDVLEALGSWVIAELDRAQTG